MKSSKKRVGKSQAGKTKVVRSYSLAQKYSMYENAVQSPDIHVAILNQMYRDLFGSESAPRTLREDFCGSFAISCEWVKLHPENTALGLDLDDEPLSYGRKTHLAKLNAAQKKRVKLLRQNAISVTKPMDIITACNFSFFIFKRRELLVDYFRCCYKSLAKRGVLILEMAGGPGMIEKSKDRRRVGTPWRGQKYTYIWDQRSFDPVTHDVFYTISFKFDDGRLFQDVFTYDWRLWSIPEVSDALKEAGFQETAAFWEKEENGKGTGEYARIESAPNDYSWIAQVAGIKK